MKTIHFETVSRYKRILEPATVGIPFKEGELKQTDIKTGCISDGKKIFPAQFHPTAYWPDESVKWLLANVQVHLPANKAIDYYYLTKAEQRSNLRLVEGSQDILVKERDNGLFVESGSMRLTMAGPGKEYLFESIEVLGNQYTHEEISGPIITDKNNCEYRLRISEDGWEIIEQGPVRAKIRTRGKHFNGDAGWFDYDIIVTIHGGKPWLQFDYQLINCEDDDSGIAKTGLALTNHQAGLKYDKEYPFQSLTAARIDLQLASKGQGSHRQLTSSFNYKIEEGGSEVLKTLISADTIINTPNEMFPEVLFSVFAGDWCDKKHGVTAGIYQAYQNFPKAIETSPTGISLQLFPKEYQHLKIPQGVARTSRFHLFFHQPDMDERMIIDQQLMLEMPPVPVVSKADYKNAGVFTAYLPESVHHKTERFLYRYVDSRAKGLGMLHFGDGPEWEYVKQGRSEGKDIWINNEYDMPHNFMVMFARSGDRRYFDYLKAATEHWYDVDLCHYSQQPFKQGLLCTHSVNHITGQAVPSHQWVEGFLDYYHVTGNPKGYEAAMEIGENLLKLMELPIYHQAGLVEPREIGWAMRTFLALYNETYQERWLDACEPIVDIYIQWGRALGTFISPYPDNYMDRVPFMIQVGIAGLYGYYNIRPSKEVRELLLQVIDDLICECYIAEGDFFFGKQHPAVRFANLNGMVLETLAIGYELTENPDYIKKGKGMFQWISEENLPPLYDFSKVKRDEFTVIYDCAWGPKRCAQTLLPFLRYYGWALELGYLKNEEW